MRCGHLTMMATRCSEHGSVEVREQHDWMIQVKDSGEDWADYWGVSTWTKDRRKALAKASESIRRQSRVRRRWRLVYQRCRSIGTIMVPACDL